MLPAKDEVRRVRSWVGPRFWLLPLHSLRASSLLPLAHAHSCSLALSRLPIPPSPLGSSRTSPALLSQSRRLSDDSSLPIALHFTSVSGPPSFLILRGPLPEVPLPCRSLSFPSSFCSFSSILLFVSPPSPFAPLRFFRFPALLAHLSLLRVPESRFFGAPCLSRYRTPAHICCKHDVRVGCGRRTCPTDRRQEETKKGAGDRETRHPDRARDDDERCSGQGYK